MPRNKVVIDANIVIAALIGSSKTFEIIYSEEFAFYAPEKMISEVQKHIKHICDKTHKKPDEIEERLQALLKIICIIRHSSYKSFLHIAQINMTRDSSDADYLACALAIKSKLIWTNDKDFSSQQLVECRTTDQLLIRIKAFKYLDYVISRITRRR